MELNQRLETGAMINKFLEKTKDDMLKDMIPMFSISVCCLDDLLSKFCGISFQIRQGGRGPNADANQEKNLLFIGKLASKLCL
jgi:hypothetical protein